MPFFARNPNHLNRIFIDGDELIADKSKHLCSVCKIETYWMSISFHCFFCSSECLEKKWNEYFESLNKNYAKS